MLVLEINTLMLFVLEINTLLLFHCYCCRIRASATKSSVAERLIYCSCVRDVDLSIISIYLLLLC